MKEYFKEFLTSMRDKVYSIVNKLTGFSDKGLGLCHVDEDDDPDYNEKEILLTITDTNTNKDYSFSKEFLRANLKYIEYFNNTNECYMHMNGEITVIQFKTDAQSFLNFQNNLNK